MTRAHSSQTRMTPKETSGNCEDIPKISREQVSLPLRSSILTRYDGWRGSWAQKANSDAIMDHPRITVE